MNKRSALLLFRSLLFQSLLFQSLLFRSTVFLVLVALAPSLVHAIDAPSDTRGTIIKPTQIKWEWAASAGAVRYQVDVNGSFVAYVEGTAYRSNDLSDGDYWFTVQAVDGNNIHSNRSQRSPTVTISAGNSNESNSNIDGNQSSTSSGDIPENVQGTQVGNNSARWVWSRVQGAASYAIYLDGDGQNPILTSEDNLVIDNLSAGEHSIKVAAVDSSTRRHSHQSVGATVTINSDFSNSSSGNNNVATPPPANDNGLIDPASWNYSEVSQKPGYQLVFSDEFNSSELNPARWNTQLRWDGEWNGERYEYRLINNEAQMYVNIFSQDGAHQDKVVSIFNPFEFDGTRLTIRSIANPLKNRDINTNYDPSNPHSTTDNYESFGRHDLIAYQQPFLSGVISSHDKFSQKYGYFEARIKIPAHLGTFPAFWLHHQEARGNTRKTEIDVMENLGHNTTHMYTAVHTYDNVVNGEGGTIRGGIKPQPYGQIITNTDHSMDFHVYGVEWKDSLIRYFIDGVQVSEIRNSVFNHEPLYPILNLAVGGIWTNDSTSAGGTGRVDEGNQFPSRQDIDNWGNPTLEIDWIRVYEAQ